MRLSWIAIIVLFLPATALGNTIQHDKKVTRLIAEVKKTVRCDAKKPDVLRYVCGLAKLKTASKMPRVATGRTLVGISFEWLMTLPLRGALIKRTSLAMVSLRPDGGKLYVRTSALQGSNPAETKELTKIVFSMAMILKKLSSSWPTYSPALAKFLKASTATANHLATAKRGARYTSYRSAKTKIPARVYMIKGLLKNPAQQTFVVLEFVKGGMHVSLFPDPAP